VNPRERILKTFNLETPDRIPSTGWFHPVIQERFKEHYKTDDFSAVLAELGIEGWGGLGPYLKFPEYEEKVTERPGGKPGARAIWLDDKIHEDAWGVRHRLGEGDWYEEWLSGPLQDAETVEDVAKYTFPDSSNIVEPDNYAAEVEKLKKQDLFVSAGIPNPYKRAWLLRGMENVLADYLINRELLEYIYDKLYALYKGMALRMAKAGVDMISITGDIAMQDRIIMGPRPWREVDKPKLANLISECRKIKPDLFFFIHSDGNVWDLMDDFIEIGFNVINPIQPECMDPVEVKKKWGDKITLHGGISLQKTLPFGSPDDVRKEVENLIKNCGYNGGLVVFPSNVIQPDTPLENIITCFQTARDFLL
jgi:uroporphyrinogen decarboxylase